MVTYSNTTKSTCSFLPSDEHNIDPEDLPLFSKTKTENKTSVFNASENRNWVCKTETKRITSFFDAKSIARPTMQDQDLLCKSKQLTLQYDAKPRQKTKLNFLLQARTKIGWVRLRTNLISLCNSKTKTDNTTSRFTLQKYKIDIAKPRQKTKLPFYCKQRLE